MIKLLKMSPDVLIYIQTIKHYFITNPDAQKYFAIEGNEKDFFDNLGEISQKNYEEHGEPELSIEQFEEIRKKMSSSPENESTIIAAFMNMGNLGYLSLN